MANSTMVELACAQLTGYKYGTRGHLLDMINAMGMTAEEWEENRKEYGIHISNDDANMIDEYFKTK